MDYSQGRRYFRAINWTLLVIILFIGIALLFLKVFIGLILLFLVVLYLFLVIYYQPTDQAIDDIYQAQIDLALEEAYEKLGLFKEDMSLKTPVVLHGPYFKAIRYDPAIKRGRDEVVRSSNYQISIFYFGKTQLHVYQQIFSIIDDEQNEETESYFYEEVVSLATASTVTRYYNETFRREDNVNLDTVMLHTLGSGTRTAVVKKLDDVSETIFDMKSMLRMRK